ncbi:MAG: sigma 54-interacting transcriptional regulator [Heliobacteriaceae bacterium]|nr:sigma 54-interacting transcriptional regulator [Heliobacteriaceae bacterium]MDD4587921.1 sigma 54-interacting transcriptional regulator [Heliobacteriaceae bacterium]
MNGSAEKSVNQLELQRIKRELESTRNLKDVLETVLDTAFEGIVVVNKKARITMFNRAFCEFLGVNQEDVLGRPVQDVIENSRMHHIVKTGVAEIGEVQQIKGNNMICSRIPLKRNNVVWGAVGKVLFRDVSDLRSLVQRVERLQTEVEFYKSELKRHQGTRFSLANVIGNSPQMWELRELVRKVAKNNSTIIIRGESGTGKEVIAHSLHNASPRAHRPFVKVNCAALPENLLESELFGYREGAFTGAKKEGKIGKFELANGGTIFLDEIGDMPLNMQVKLLRVLQEKEIEPLGSTRPVKVNVRIVAATNRSLEDMIQKGTFREDLFYRLNVVMLHMPPLRNRTEDIPLLVDYLMKKLAGQMGCLRKSISPDAWDCLLSYHWPGNVRELENVLERALNLVEDDIITKNHLPYYLRCGNPPPPAEGITPLKQAVEKLEQTLILRALEATAGDCQAASRLLKISKSSFYEKMARYGFSKQPVFRVR